MEPWTDSRTPALAIVARGDQIETVAPSQFRVRSQSHPERLYMVSVIRDRWACTCEYNAATKRSCIHLLAVKLRSGLQETKPSVEAGPVCESCQSGDVFRWGKRHNKSGTIPRYRCRTCNATFTGRDGFQKRRADPEVIARALDLYFRGMSFRQVRDHLSEAYGLTLSPMTVYRWVTHYSRLAAEWMDSQGAKVGEQWHVDETVVSVDGDKHFVWNLMDSETRFLIATHVSRTRTMAHTRAPFKKAKKVTATIPKEVRSDGMPAYPEAIKKEFGRYRRPGDPPSSLKNQGSKAMWSPHKVVPSIRAAESNNILERLNGSMKDRTKVMRGFDTERGTAALVDGWRVHYDMVRNHIALGTTPGVAAGLPELGGFKWRALLDLATNRRVTAETEAVESTD